MKKRPEDSGKIIVTGRQPCIEALASQWPVKEIIIREGSSRSLIEEVSQLAGSRHVSCEVLNSSTFDARFGPKAQGIAIVTSDVKTVSLEQAFEAIPSGQKPFFVALDGIQDPHNLGAISRSAYAMGVHALVVPRHRSAPLAEGAAKSSAGAIFYQTISEVPNIDSFLRWGKDKGLWMYGLEAEANRTIWDQDLRGPIGLVVGSEGKGLSRLVKERCDFLVKIPIAGNLGSLNASVAAGIAIYEVARQRISSY